MEEAALYEAPFEYVSSYVQSDPVGTQSRATIADSGGNMHEPRPEMRAALPWQERYIATPDGLQASLLCLDASRSCLANQLTVVFARDDDYFFGVLHSRVHELWARATGTQLREAESGFRYTPTTTFETFPCPWPPGHEPADDPRWQPSRPRRGSWWRSGMRGLNPGQTFEVSETSKVSPPRTLTALYNARPTWLDLAHRALDAAVLDAYGWPHDVSDEEILARLLALNLAWAT